MGCRGGCRPRLSCWLCSWEGWPGTGHPRRVSWRGRRVLAWSSLPHHGPKRGEGPWSSAGSSPMARTQCGPRTGAEAPRAQRSTHDLKDLFKRGPSSMVLGCHLSQKSDDCRSMGLFLDCPVPLICLPNFIPAPHWINYYTYMGGPEIWRVSSPTFSSSPSGRPSRSLALCISV